MMEVDWVELWRELAGRVRRPENDGGGERVDRWSRRARSFDAAVKRKGGARPDPILDFVAGSLQPGDTVVDVGAGTGSFTIPMARVARRVTAVEPSPSMAAILKENAAAEGLANLDVVEAAWEDAEVEQHDVVLCSHAMYSIPDLVGFVRKMEGAARRACFLLMRVPSHDGVMAELSRRIYGQPHDSPNFVVGYNVLYGMGIYANVMMEQSVRYWADDTLDDAQARAKRHLRLGDARPHDDMIRELLARRLAFRDGRYHWPDGMRSALAWWDVGGAGSQ